MRKISIETLKQILARRKSGEYLDMWEIELSEADLSGWNLAEIDFSLSQLWSLVDENFVYRKGQWVEVRILMRTDGTIRQRGFIFG